MRTAIWTGGRQFVIEDRPEPHPGPGEVRVRVAACGVCLTEVHSIDGLLVHIPPPRLMGHEYGGVIDAVGEGVDGLDVGTPVACAGRTGYAEQSVLRTDQVYPLQPGVPVEHGAFLEPMLCCATAVQQARLRWARPC